MGRAALVGHDKPLRPLKCRDRLIEDALKIHGVFEIKNIGRVAAYNWRLIARRISIEKDDRSPDYKFSAEDFPVQKPRNTTVSLDITILPGCEFHEAKVFGIQLRPKHRTIAAVRDDLESLLAGTTLFHYQLASETSPGELIPISLLPVIDLDALVEAIRQKCDQYFAAGAVP